MARRRAYANLLQYFKRSGVTQAQFAKRMNVTQATISRYAHGLQQPPLDFAFEIAAAANIPVESLIMDTKPVIAVSGDDHV